GQAAPPARPRAKAAGHPVPPQRDGTRRRADAQPETPAQRPAPDAVAAAPTKATGRRQRPVREEQPALALELPAPVKRASRAKAMPTEQPAGKPASEPSTKAARRASA